MKRLIFIFLFAFIGMSAVPENTGRIVCKKHFTCVTSHPESCYAYDSQGLRYRCCVTKNCPDQ